MNRPQIIPMHLQFFAEADTGSTGSTDMQNLDTLLSTMSTQNTTTATDNSADTGETGTTSQAEGGTQATTDTATDQTTATDKPEMQPDKQGHAFAQMRVQNTQLLELAGKVAKAAGIDYKDTADLLSKLSDDALNKIAKAQNVPPELLKRMDTLEQTSKLYEAQQLQQNAMVGFQRVKDSYGLTDDELKAFAIELDRNGKNPFTSTVDLEAEYKVTHFDEIVTRRTKKAVEEALKKSSAADQHSSTPNNANGKPDSGNTEKITTIAGLSALMDGMKK